MLPNVAQVAHGKWVPILVSLGLDEGLLDGKHHACPVCGGKDRFRFDDKNGSGSYFCSGCGAGYGIGLLMKVYDWSFAEAAAKVEEKAGFVKPEQSKVRDEHSLEAKLKSLRKVWKESKRIVVGDEVHRYLTGRGLSVPPGGIRFHPGLHYRDGDKVLTFPAMTALVTAPDGTGATIHRTYLQNGIKAPVSDPKRLMPGNPIKGAAVRLFQPGPCLGIAEGIETALAASTRFGIPVWSAISAVGLESWVCPPDVETVIVCGDNDESYTGQAAAYSLAQRLVREGKKVEVRIPEKGDWADEV